MYQFLFLDLDDTILDFQQAERRALSGVLTAHGITPSEEILRRYSRINKACWEQLERQELTRDQVLSRRFELLLEQFTLRASPDSLARAYEAALAHQAQLLPGARAALEQLQGDYQLYLVSNGSTHIQNCRIDGAGIRPFFRRIFISQEIGINKPDPGFFLRCFSAIPDFDPARAMIVGDSLSSDIQGGINAGIATCWVNPRRVAAAGPVPDLKISSLDRLRPLLDSLS